jgi:hypothetical protein
VSHCPVCERPTFGNPALCVKCARAFNKDCLDKSAHWRDGEVGLPLTWDVIAWAAKRARNIERRRRQRSEKR